MPPLVLLFHLVMFVSSCIHFQGDKHSLSGLLLDKTVQCTSTSLYLPPLQLQNIHFAL